MFHYALTLSYQNVIMLLYFEKIILARLLSITNTFESFPLSNATYPLQPKQPQKRRTW